VRLEIFPAEFVGCGKEGKEGKEEEQRDEE
jgi:hypothetical protein